MADIGGFKNAAFRNVLVALRKRLKLTLQDVSDKSGVNISTLSLFENFKAGLSDEAQGKVVSALLTFLDKAQEDQQREKERERRELLDLAINARGLSSALSESLKNLAVGTTNAPLNKKEQALVNQ